MIRLLVTYCNYQWREQGVDQNTIRKQDNPIKKTQLMIDMTHRIVRVNDRIKHVSKLKLVADEFYSVQKPFTEVHKNFKIEAVQLLSGILLCKEYREVIARVVRLFLVSSFVFTRPDTFPLKFYQKKSDIINGCE